MIICFIWQVKQISQKGLILFQRTMDLNHTKVEGDLFRKEYNMVKKAFEEIFPWFLFQ